MSYLDVITLKQAKDYLRVDSEDSDAEITRMIKSALSLIEKQTNIILYDRNKNYIYHSGVVRVYDYPINSTTSTTHTSEDFGLYTTYCDAESKTIEINVGHDDPTDIPFELIDAALEMIDYWYYKNDGKANITLIPMSVQAVIDLNKRFIL